MRGLRRFLLIAAVVAVSGVLASGVLAAGTQSNAGTRAAADPCAGLPGVYGTACQKDLQACQSLPASQASIKSQCLTAIQTGFHALYLALSSCGKLPASSKASCLAVEKQALAALQAQAAAAAKPPGGGGGSTTTTTSGGPAPPVSGKSADAAPVTGTVLVNGAPLTQGTSIPVGATVDTTNGTVTLTSVSPTGATQKAQFHSGVFQLKQAKHGVTELVLKGGDFATCSTKGRRLAAAPPSTAVVRQLWGNGKGTFQTTGRYAAATVRGTVWDTQDRCDGTNIVVKQGVVAVVDRARHTTVTVTAGHSYLAKR